MTEPLPRAAYASDPAHSRGRLNSESESPTRSAFQRDRDRIIHSSAFRRLKHKTQVFVFHEGDHYRTRLTHSLEVAQIARSVCRIFALDEDLGEALALAHDFGHTPFGHTGEHALNEMMADYGGFDHNAQTLRILTKLEHRYAEFDGLNLTWESLEGVVKHNGPLSGNGEKPVPDAITRYNTRHDLEVNTYPGPEAQIAALSDDIAYNNHDVDDGLREGLFEIDDLKDVPLAGPALQEVLDKYPGLDRSRLIHETVRRMINAMVTDLVSETRKRVAADAPQSVSHVRALDHPIASFSAGMQEQDKALKSFLFEHMYRHKVVTEQNERAHEIVQTLFRHFFETSADLPDDWRAMANATNIEEPARARVIADYLAGMTDTYALTEFERLGYKVP
jgi:dGTPase